MLSTGSEAVFFHRSSSAVISNMSRRRFIGLSALGVLCLVTQDLLHPAIASANSDAPVNNNIIEKYHIFVPYHTAKAGGIKTVNLRSGKNCEVTIPPRSPDLSEITVKGRGLQGNDISIIIHTMYDPRLSMEGKIYQTIDEAKFIKNQLSKNKCKYAYDLLEDAEYVEDLAILELLDYVIASSTLDENIKQCYQIASQNNRLLGIEAIIKLALKRSILDETKKKLLRGTYQYVRSSEPVPNFSDLNELDTIIQNSNVSVGVKQNYLLASAKSRALTVDVIIINVINNSPQLTAEEKEKYLSVYKQIRDGKEVSEQETLNYLNLFILNADILESCKVVYFLAQDRFFAQGAESAKQNFSSVAQVAKLVTNVGVNIAPTSANVLTSIGVETATGVALSSLSGGAATTTMLATLGGGSVAAGGLGMLGGLAVVTGGAALIGAAGLLSVALVSKMDGQDLRNLGVAGFTGTLAGAAAVLVAWTGASALGVAGTLSGAAAITTTISALGGLSVITGGAALIAFGTGFLVWSFMKGQKHRDQNIMNNLEARIYTLTEKQSSPYLAELIKFIKTTLNQEVFTAPDIPVDKLSNALSTYALIDSEEKILALKERKIGSQFDDPKKGILFTDKRVMWKSNFLNAPDFIYYSDLKEATEKVPKLLDNDNENTNFYQTLQEIGEKYSLI